MLENDGHMHVYSPGAGAQPPGVNFFLLTVLFSQYTKFGFDWTSGFRGEDV